MINVIAVIQAGGFGKRMSELTQDKIPKPMLKLNGKNLIERQIECLVRYGIRDIVIIVGHLGHVIQDYFMDGSKWDVRINYIEEKDALGSAGALFYLKECLPANHYLFLFGDIVFDMDLKRFLNFHLDHSAKISIVAHPNSHPFDSDIIQTDDSNHVKGILFKGNRTEWYENLVCAGISIFENSVLNEINKPVCLDWEHNVVEPLTKNNEVFVYRTSEYIKDVGTVERFRSAELEQANGMLEKRNLERKQRCIFLDRDGTINKLNGLIDEPDKLELMEHSAEAIRIINQSPFLTIIVTNQPVIAKGGCSIEELNDIHKKLATELGNQGVFFDDLVFCPHHPDSGFEGENPKYKIVCDCRKPKTGLIKQMVDKYNIDLSNSYFIGDTTRDIQTGKNAGTKTILVHTGEAGTDEKYDVKADMEADDLLEAVKRIMIKEGIKINYEQKIRDYIETEKQILSCLNFSEISDVINILENTRITGKRVFICGNGGSAATASHFTCDFNKGVSYNQEIKYNFECLNDNVPMMMAIANDIGYEDIFVEPLKNKMQKEDVLIVISGSGNSKNVVKAMKYAKSIGATTIGLVGFDGGEIKKLADHCIHVNINNIQIVEDIHMVMDHVMMHILSAK